MVLVRTRWYPSPVEFSDLLRARLHPSPCASGLLMSSSYDHLPLSGAIVSTTDLPYSYPTSSLPASFKFLNRSGMGGVTKLMGLSNRGSRRARSVCRAEFVHDAPFAAAIAACVFTSLASPILCVGGDDEEDDGDMGSTDARFVVMAVISFIPYFNWLSWIFAWLDTSRPRYLVYSAVYLAPYLRTNLSLSPEESWLPIASILVCIFHVQLEASIRNGDLEGFAFFNQASNMVPPFIKKKDPPITSRGKPSQEKSKNVGLPPFAEEQRERIQEWGIPREQNEGSDEIREKKSD